MDLLFAEEVTFRLPTEVARRCTHTTASMEDAFRAALHEVGLELVEYDTCRFQSLMESDETLIIGHSRQWREKLRG